MFRQWAILHAIGAAAERRVWTQLQTNRLFPNLFVFLVGPPGVGKSQAINPASEMLRKAQCVGLAPNDLTKQGLLDALAENARGAVIEGRPFDYHFMAIAISELSNFMPKYDESLAGILTDLFDCPAINEEKKRSHDKGKPIPFPGISMLAGTATKNLGRTVSDAAWGSGFMARVIMVYSADEIVPDDMFAPIEGNEEIAQALVAGLSAVGQMKGPMEWDPEARALIKTFRKNQKDGAPLHNRLEHYVTRRWLHLTKLCMVAALANQTMVVDETHFNMAFEWLLAAEFQMPEIFKDMQGHEDGEVLEEMRSQFYAIHTMTKRPIAAQALHAFLSKRTASHNVQRMVQIAEAAGYFNRVAGTSGDDAEYVPQLPFGKNLGVI